ncbi:MAG: response regulator [Thermodesulfobacteriota bacterium]|nr:response regulator [Thermodesulfobacteriota bacterium]
MNFERVFLLPGEYIISKKPHEVTTLLGSCVAVCLYSNKGKFGGVNHFMLPVSATGERHAKYGDFATKTIVQFLERGTGTLRGAEAMIFGGANVVGAIRSATNIGEKNIEIARRLLGDYKIPIVKEYVGGETGLKLKYQTWDNQVFYRPIERSQFAKTMLAKKDDLQRKDIRVLVVDDSPLVRNILIKAMHDEPGIEVVGQAADAFEARELLVEKDPDVITLDIIMPKMDGISFLKKIMVYYPKPVIIVSTIAKSGSKVELRADKIGAVDIIDKESLNLYEGLDKIKSVLIPKIRAAAHAYVTKKGKEEVGGI